MVIRYKVSWMLPILAAGLFQLVSCTSTQREDRIHLTVSGDRQELEVAYRLALPAMGIALARTPDESRRERWRFGSPGFEIAHENGNDVIRRTDREAFSSVTAIVPATYIPLPKDYAPFSPFSDDGLLIHSGRFQACPLTANRSTDDCDGPWSMQINAPPDAHILLNGEKHDLSARWLDSDSGTKVYVGSAIPRSNSNFVGIVDPVLPAAISDLVSASLPEIMEQFGRRLPPLAQRPMLFVSYDPDYERGHGRQGGTLPNQIFMHFYGPAAKTGEAVDNTPEDVLWFFAHEAAHLFQHGVSGDLESSWIHEGSAEAFAYLLLRDLGAVSEDYLDERRRRAFHDCVDALERGPLTTAAERGSFADYYQCGLTMFIAIDDEIRVNSGNRQDLFSFWTALIGESSDSDPWDTSRFLRSAETQIGPDLAKQLRSLSLESQDKPEEALARL